MNSSFRGRSRMADEIKYEYKTVQTVRGTDGLVIAKMQKDGWELVEQAQGMLRSSLDFHAAEKAAAAAPDRHRGRRPRDPGHRHRRGRGT